MCWIGCVEQDGAKKGTEGVGMTSHVPDPGKTRTDTDLSTLYAMQSQKNRALRSEIERVYQRYSDVLHCE